MADIQHHALRPSAGLFEPARFKEDVLASKIREELPGIAYQLRHDEGTWMVVMEFQRVREEYRAAISDEAVYQRDGEYALHDLTLKAIDEMREKAMKDYGLRAILEREKVEAHKKGFAAMVENMKGYVTSNMKDWVTVLDGEGKEQEIPEVSREGQRILSWLETLSSE